MKWYSRIPGIATTSWQITSTIGIVGAVFALLLFARLDSLLPGYGPAEIEAAKGSSSLSVIQDNPVNAPFKLVTLVVSELTDRPVLATRLTSAAVGVVTIILFYVGVRRWHSARISFLATLLFATSAWFLHVARFGSADIMLPFSVLLLAVAGYWVVTSARSGVGYVAVLIALGRSLFVPGMIWFILGAIIVRRGKDVQSVFRHFSFIQVLGLFLLFIVGVVGPITWALLNHPSIALQLLGLPPTIPDYMTFLQNLAVVPFSLFVATTVGPEMWLGNLPYLDIFTSVMFVLGLYFYVKSWGLDRSKLLITFMILGSILVAFDGVHESILLPGVYIAAAGGIALLLSQWWAVFPNNPLAQNVAVGLILLAVSLSTVYNLRAYFVAWPQAPETKATYQLQRSNLVQ